MNDQKTTWNIAGRDALAPLVAHIKLTRIPKVLYHYTTAQGLLGIIESKSIWASHIRHLNDLSEIAYSNDLLNQAFNEFESELKESQRAGFKLLRQVLEMYAIKAGKIRGDTFITAFSEKEDHLSQWERYSGARGYAIGFDLPETMTSSGGPIFNFVPIEYRPHVQLQILKDVLKIGFDALLAVGDDHRTLENLSEWANSYANVLIVASHHFKNEAFSEEGEWRIATRTRSETFDDIKFRVGQYGIIPYIALDFASHAHLIVKKIFVAPTNYFDEAKNALELRLLASGLDPMEIEIVESLVPLRT